MYIITTTVSSIEFYKNMSIVIFMAKCPLKCIYCSNVEAFEIEEEMTFEEVKEIIDTNADFMDAVVISGGEPLVQINDVIDILTYVRTLGLKTKLDTSGIYPQNIKKLLDLNLLDVVSLDVKAPFDQYESITG
ncbi:MAG: radical SAM protein, partial [archaeon]|nr:radical SAM protein [archaeon]